MDASTAITVQLGRPQRIAGAPERDPTVLAGGVYRAELTQEPESAGFFAVEVAGGPGVGWRYPDARGGAPSVGVAP